MAGHDVVLSARLPQKATERSTNVGFLGDCRKARVNDAPRKHRNDKCCAERSRPTHSPNHRWLAVTETMIAIIVADIGRAIPNARQSLRPPSTGLCLRPTRRRSTPSQGSRNRCRSMDERTTWRAHKTVPVTPRRISRPRSRTEFYRPTAASWSSGRGRCGALHRQPAARCERAVHDADGDRDAIRRSRVKPTRLRLTAW